MTIKEYVLKRKQELKEIVSSLNKRPVLIIINANTDEASKAYIKGKLKDAEELDIEARLIQLDPDISEPQLLKIIDTYNNDNEVDGIIVQLPLKKHINEHTIKLAISPKKDVDGFHPLSKLNPCTPQGIINYLEAINTDFVGKNAVVIGRSYIVGRPMATLLLNKDCSTTILHSHSKFEDIKFYVSHADIIVIAIGQKGFLDNRFTFKKEAIVIDVGISRDIDGTIKGDVMPGLDVKYQSPVPGGVGLLTRLALYENLISICKGDN